MVKKYLNKISLTDALKKLKDRFKDFRTESEKIKTVDAEGRVTVNAVMAKRSAPDFYAAAMDGIAVEAQKTAGASERAPIQLEIGSEAQAVDTGDPIPEQFNAVIKIEEVNQTDENHYTIEKAVPPWNHIRSIGESTVKGNLLVTASHKLSDYDLAALLEAGVTEIEVYQKPLITIIPTGDELVNASENPKIGELVEFNSQMVKAALKKWGAEIRVTEIIADQKELIEKAVVESVKASDMVIVLSGSSAGRGDYTIDILKKQGKILFHGVNIMPGKPLIAAEVKGIPVFGLPGYPLSAWLDNHLFIRELVYLMQAESAPNFKQIEAEVKRKVSSEIGLEEFLRVNLINQAENKFTAVPLKRGSSAMESILKADGIMRISENKEGLHPGDRAPVILLKEKNRIKNDLLLIGSHDLSLDLIRNEIRKRNYNFDLKLQTVGSMAGLTALRRGESHLAGAHLLDPENGEYNVSYLRKFFKGQKLLVVNLVYREQGLYLKKGNPKNIANIDDLTQNNINYINRQRGAGTRVLFDFLLSQNEIETNQISGYEKEEYTHIAAAAAVGRGSADAALGIRAAAEVMDVDFLPLAEEKYDLIIKAENIDDPRINKLIKLISENKIKSKIENLGGYNCQETGNIKKLQL
ncbi:Molybdopterin biosynthesis protein MoeA / Periplasmic molybdate-binding domain [Halanaerobium saccharolyticum subsp. saccharolyticum DSM 6643]|uniref:Molybdopterin molybdenumtransferase n=1 Tax=Halanaerobium saccharolyticum subsp. saccharolyticum DSM 6643 TaxID=1293054 RepID=M5DZD0_9FIRM|nr:molybdopterin biosynthesis protein [Halanaerobium saccharolyticum]CCU78468.1 Molybdopterin biosynthesis protein MoeA / Periplasmic molybdate-binding domain [Halanaerobium saccharolyticum subsp. saccharolyticum DSM 6643]